MGYMGFGMQKDHYTRKPKTLFRAVKKHYGDDVDIPKTEPPAEAVIPSSPLKRKRFKQFYESRAFRNALVILLMGVLITGVAAHWIKELIASSQRRDFEQNGITSYYYDHKTDFFFINEYMRENAARVLSINYDRRSDAYGFFIQDETISPTTPRDQITFYHDPHARIVQGNLMTRDSVISTHWKCSVGGVKPGNITPSVLQYINTPPDRFNHLLQVLRNENIGAAYDTPGRVSINFHHPKYGAYSIVFTDGALATSTYKMNKMTVKYRIRLIEKGVYWMKIE